MAAKGFGQLNLAADVVGSARTVEKVHVGLVHRVQLEEVGVHAQECRVHVWVACHGAVGDRGDLGRGRELVSQGEDSVHYLRELGVERGLAVAGE